MSNRSCHAGGVATLNNNNLNKFCLRSPATLSDGSFLSPEESLYPLQWSFNPSTAPPYFVSQKGSKRTMTPSIGGKKASAVEELKALILACDAGTGEVARHIEEAQFTPRHNAFTSLLQLASKSRQPEKAVEIFEAMQSITGITPNTFSYSALISALARVGDWQQAERYFNELLEHSKTNSELRPNTVTYAAMISGKQYIKFHLIAYSNIIFAYH